MEMSGNGHRIGMVYIAVKLKRILQVLYLDPAKCTVEDVGITILNIAVSRGFAIPILLLQEALVRVSDSHCKWVGYSFGKLVIKQIRDNRY